MYNRNRRVLTTMDEDFRAIGLLPPLSETDDPSKAREVPSPDPSTLSGLDDTEGDKKAHTPASKQPKPKMGPAADDAAKSGYDPEDDGGSKGAQKGSNGKYSPPSGGKESSIKGESKAAYQAGSKVHPAGKGKNKGGKPAVAMGLKPVKKLAGMRAEGSLGKAANLIEEVEQLLRGVQVDEEVDSLMRGFRLVSENAALLADRLTEIADRYEVEETIASLESLSRDAAEVLVMIENDIELGPVGDDEDEANAIAHSAEAQEDVDDIDEDDAKKVKSDRDPDKEYDVPSPAFKEDAERLFKVHCSVLMDALEGYDGALDDMNQGDQDQPDQDQGEPTEADDMDAYEASDDTDDDGGDDADDSDSDDDGDNDADDHGGEDDGDADDKGGDLMSKMKALRAKKGAMGGGGEKQPPFRAAD